jgi:CTP:molybdopterin cytidylyltransferase MocA
LGRAKQLLELGGEPLLRHTVRNAVASSLNEVLVVLGSRAGEIAKAVGELGQRTVVNPAFAEGQSTSLVVGMAALAAETDAVLVLLGDQPLVSTAAIDRLVARFQDGDSDIVQAAYEGQPGNPVLFGRGRYGDLASVSGDEGARSIVRRHRDAVTLVEIGGVAKLIDVDTEADYARLTELWNTRRSSDGG